jgi:hypothetical protein
MSDNNLWCTLISVIIISFLIGYTTGFFVYNKCSVVQPHMMQDFYVNKPAPKPEPPLNPGSERFHNTASSTSYESTDYDDKVVSRMKSSPKQIQ